MKVNFYLNTHLYSSSIKQSDLGQLCTIPSQTQTLISVTPFFNQKIYLKKGTNVDGFLDGLLTLGKSKI